MDDRHFTTPNSSCRFSNDQYVILAHELSARCWAQCDGGNCGSLYSGHLGPCSFLRLRVAKTGDANDSTLLQKALDAADIAIDRHSSSPGRLTLLEGRMVGALTMKVAILHTMGKCDEAKAAARKLLLLGRVAADLPEDECEVLYGRAGYLQAVYFVRACLFDSSFGAAIVQSLVDTIIATGRRTAKERGVALPLMWEWHGKMYLGAAHGVVGILYTLLCFIEELGDDATALVRLSIERLNGECFQSGNLKSSIGKSPKSDRLVQWCHGAPGHVLLLVKAFDVFNEPKFLRKAEDISRNIVFSRGLLQKGVGLCHGISGNAYCFLAVYRGRILETRRSARGAGAMAPAQEDEFLMMARDFAGFAIDRLHELELVSDRPYSLYEGLAGFVSLLFDLPTPEESSFPCFGS